MPPKAAGSLTCLFILHIAPENEFDHIEPHRFGRSMDVRHFGDKSGFKIYANGTNCTMSDTTGVGT